MNWKVAMKKSVGTNLIRALLPVSVFLFLSQVVEKDEPIPAGGRVTQLLTQYFGSLNGQDRSSGYIRVRTNLGVASFALFGTKLGTSLSAVPAQQIK